MENLPVIVGLVTFIIGITIWIYKEIQESILSRKENRQRIMDEQEAEKFSRDMRKRLQRRYFEEKRSKSLQGIIKLKN